jgi:hypothetical protein
MGLEAVARAGAASGGVAPRTRPATAKKSITAPKTDLVAIGTFVRILTVPSVSTSNHDGTVGMRSTTVFLVASKLLILVFMVVE